MARPDPRVTLKGDRKRQSRQQICIPVAPVHQKPDPNSGLDSQLVFGSLFDVYKESGNWAWGQEAQSDKAGYVGYIPKAALISAKEKPTHRVSVLRAPVFSLPDLKSPIRYLLPLNSLVTLDQSHGKYHQVKSGGYLHDNHIVLKSTRNEDFVAFAEQHIGLPYIWGGISSDGLDCSGLIQSSLRAVGKQAPRDSDMQELALGKPITVNSQYSGLKRGDLVFWKGHVGIMTDAKNLLHANAFHMCVENEPLNEAARRIAKTAGPITSIKRFR
jgi:cell wall-associated NlpC family hydrolase